MKAPATCAEPGCPEAVESGRCPRHDTAHLSETRRRYDRQRGTARARGYTHAWDKYRKRYLAEHPFCEHCRDEGTSSLAEEVDHIEPVQGPDDPLFWRRDNHQGLCRTHHARKTARERGKPRRVRKPQRTSPWRFA